MNPASVQRAKSSFLPLAIKASLLLAAGLLSGCVAKTVARNDPFAEFNALPSPYKNLDLVLLTSGGTKNTLETLQESEAAVAAMPLVPRLDAEAHFTGVRDVLKSHFRSVSRLRSLDEAKAAKVDVIAVLDIHATVGTRSRAKTRFEDKLTLLTPDGRILDIVEIDGEAIIPWPASSFMLAEASQAALVNLNGALRRSTKLQELAHAGSRVAAEETKPAMTSPGSDVDTPPTAVSPKRKTDYAVVIGIERYRQNLPPATFAAHDAETMTAYLTKVMGYPDENVITLLNDHASNVDIAKYIERWLPNNADPTGSVFVYYSGHGAPDPKSGGAYLVPYDGDPAFIDETGYSLKRMYAALGKLPVKRVLVALDSCFSGAGGRSVIAPGARPLVTTVSADSSVPANMTVLTASSNAQTSSTYDEKGHGLLTYFILKGMQTGVALRPDGTIKTEELYIYLKPQVESIARKKYNNEQSPQLIRGQ